MPLAKPVLSPAVYCDVVIVGAGGAGLRCAAEILERRPRTEIVALTKVVHPQKSHTSTAQGGMAVVDPADREDKVAYHMFDTWKGSDCMADQDVIKFICENSWDQIRWLENRGLHFTRDMSGSLAKRTFGGHTLRFGESLAFRCVFEADRTGKGIMDATWLESLKRKVAFMTQTMALELIIDQGRCLGCVAFEQKTGRLIPILAKAVVLASGGSGQVFKVTTNCRQNTGDALALALRAGLPVMDPEAVQFHPTGIVGPGILASEAMRSEGGLLRNKDGEAFMVRYAAKLKDLAPRDLVSRAIETEIREGRGVLNPDHGIEHVWIDLRHLSDYVHDDKLKEITGFFRKFVNLDPKTQLCPVRPSNHYHMGGVPTDVHGRVQDMNQAALPGLYAVGECACASFHGFNRLATNSLLELITMGERVGRTVINELPDQAPSAPSGTGQASQETLADYMTARGGESVGLVRNELRNLMTEQVGIFRTEESISGAIDQIGELRDRAQRIDLTQTSLVMNQELAQRLELDNLFLAALAMAHGALNRRESRGAHFREDYPERLDEFNDHTLVSLDETGQATLGSRPVDMSILESDAPGNGRFGLIQRKY